MQHKFKAGAEVLCECGHCGGGPFIISFYSSLHSAYFAILSNSNQEAVIKGKWLKLV